MDACCEETIVMGARLVYDRTKNFDPKQFDGCAHTHFKGGPSGWAIYLTADEPPRDIHVVGFNGKELY